MKFFAIITIMTIILLAYARPFTSGKFPHKKEIPAFIKNNYQNFKKNFRHPENARVLWAFLTGQKISIPPQIKKTFTDLQLNFLFSPSGLHLSAFLSLIFYFFKRRGKKKNISPYLYQAFFIIPTLILPYLAMKRIALLRLLILLQRFFKKKIPIEVLFLITFMISFLLGHLQQSSLGYIFSFLYMGTFIALRDRSRATLLLAIFSNHLIICLFSGQELSLISLIVNLPLIGIFTFLLPFFYLYLLSFPWIHFNWIEPIVNFFILIVQWSAKSVQGTFISSSIFLILAIWVILLKKQKIYLALFLFLHGNIIL